MFTIHLETKEHAKLLYQRIAERFSVQLGMMYDFAAGPHKFPQFEATHLILLNFQNSFLGFY